MTSGIITPADAVSDSAWDSRLEAAAKTAIDATSPELTNGCSHCAKTSLAPVCVMMRPSATEAGHTNRIVMGKWEISVGMDNIFSLLTFLDGMKNRTAAIMKKSGENCSHLKAGPCTYCTYSGLVKASTTMSRKAKQSAFSS